MANVCLLLIAQSLEIVQSIFVSDILFNSCASRVASFSCSPDFVRNTTSISQYQFYSFAEINLKIIQLVLHVTFRRIREVISIKQ